MITDYNTRFKQIRTELGFTQSEMAEKLEVKQATIADIERGRNGVSVKVRNKLFDKLPINEGWFYTGKGEKFIANYRKTKGSNEGLNEGFSDESEQLLALHKARFNDLIKAKYPLFEQLSKDIIQILSAQEILRELGNTKLTQVIFFKDEKLKKDIFYNDFKNISYQSFMEILPYKDFIHEYAEATRLFIDKLKEFKDEIELNFEFE